MPKSFGVWGLGFGISCAAALTMAACAKAKAEPLPESPPLVMPAPPPRVLAPVDSEPVASAPPVPETPPATPPPRTAARPPAARPRTTPPPAASETPPPQEQAPPSTPAVAATPAPSAEPPRELKSVDAAADQKVRDVLARAAKDLSRVDYQKLSADGRSQYDQSKRLAEQAETALKERNTVFAATVADKAATLAAELLGR